MGGYYLHCSIFIPIWTFCQGDVPGSLLDRGRIEHLLSLVRAFSASWLFSFPTGCRFGFIVLLRAFLGSLVLRVCTCPFISLYLRFLRFCFFFSFTSGGTGFCFLSRNARFIGGFFLFFENLWGGKSGLWRTERPVPRNRHPVKRLVSWWSGRYSFRCGFIIDDNLNFPARAVNDHII